MFYLEDRQKYNLHVHYDTTNTSFLRQSHLLNQKGIKNNKFMLYISQPELMKYNPHDITDPSVELASKIAYECKINPWYFIREIVRVPAQGGDPKPYILHRGNMALTWCFYQNIDTFLMLPRQHFKTVSTMAIAAHIVYFATMNYPISLFTKDSIAVRDNVERLKEIRDGLPRYLMSPSSKDKDNEEGITYDHLNNRYKTICASNDFYGADRKAKGGSMAFQHWDEVDFIKHLRVMYGAALSATNEARENARAVGAPHANILTSTAGFLDTDEGEFAHSIRSDAMMFYDKLYDCTNEQALRELLKTNSANNMVLVIYSFLQLGRTMAWMDEVRAREKQPEAKIQRDYYLISTSGQDGNEIPVKHLENLRRNQIDPVFTELTQDKVIIHWYVSQEFRNSKAFSEKKYVLGLDSSEGIGRDAMAGVLTDTTDMSVVFKFKVNEINVVKFGMFIARFLVDNPNVIFIPEAKSSGVQILDIVLSEFQKNGINPFKRIFNNIVQNIEDKKYKEIDIYRTDVTDSKLRKEFGYRTAGSGSNSRSILFSDTLFRALEINSSRIYDAEIINEFCGLKIKNSKLDHTASGHDDLVVAYLLTCYFLYYGKNLSTYGVESKHLMSRIDAKGNYVDPKVRDEQEEILDRMQELDDLIKHSTSTMLTQHYKRELGNLQTLVAMTPNFIEKPPVAMNEVITRPTLDYNKMKGFTDMISKLRNRSLVY